MKSVNEKPVTSNSCNSVINSLHFGIFSTLVTIYGMYYCYCKFYSRFFGNIRNNKNDKIKLQQNLNDLIPFFFNFSRDLLVKLD